MSTVLASHGLHFRTAWLEALSNKWDLLAPSWATRQRHLEERGYKEAYQTDAFYQWAADFLALQGVARLSPEAWSAYRKSGYAPWALAGGTAYPSPDEAHAHLQALTDAMQKLFAQARSESPLDMATLMSVLRFGGGSTPSFRTEAVNGPIRSLPPTEVEAAFGALLAEIHAQLAAGASPIAIAAWAHHAVTQIRPFTDGNARTAFLLTQYILWRRGLPGLYLKSGQRLAYYMALKAADEGHLQPWTELVLLGLQQAVLYALSWTPAQPLPYDAAVQSFTQRLAQWRTRQDRERSQRIITSRYTVFDYMEEALRSIARTLEEKLKPEEGRGARALVAKAYPDSPYYHQFTEHIVEYARQHGYYFNRSLARGWFKLKFSLSASKKYQLVFTLHHAGYEDATMVVGAFLHFLEPLKYQQKRERRRSGGRGKRKALYYFAPLPFYAPPMAFSIEQDAPSLRTFLKAYAESLLGQALSEITHEIY